MREVGSFEKCFYVEWIFGDERGVKIKKVGKRDFKWLKKIQKKTKYSEILHWMLLREKQM